jgi:outer membrane protein TolC
LVQRRPDIAIAERQGSGGERKVGIAMAVFYPTLTLSASAGFQSTSLAKWFSLPSRFSSVGPQMAETLFERRDDAARRQPNSTPRTMPPLPPTGKAF